MTRPAILILALLVGCAAPPSADRAPVVVEALPVPSPTPRDQALGLYGPADPEPATPVATYDGQEGAADFYDPDNPGVGYLQRAAEATVSFPRDRLGNIDWVRALAEGHIEPRSDLLGVRRMSKLDSAILLTATRDMPYVRFPHREHVAWLDCSNCHPSPFATEVGATQMNMTAILAGEYCGVCHDRVAFSTFACERCHNVPNPNAPASTW